MYSRQSAYSSIRYQVTASSSIPVPPCSTESRSCKLHKAIIDRTLLFCVFAFDRAKIIDRYSNKTPERETAAAKQQNIEENSEKYYKLLNKKLSTLWKWKNETSKNIEA